MAKKNVVLIKLLSTAGTGAFYVYRKKNLKGGAATKLNLKKYDWVVRKHVPFEEVKMK